LRLQTPVVAPVAVDYTALEQVLDELVPPVLLKVFDDALDEI